MKKTPEQISQIKGLADELESIDVAYGGIMLDSVITFLGAAKRAYLDRVASNKTNTHPFDRWITQTEACQIMQYGHRGRISHLIKEGRLRTNGKSGRACRVLLSDILLVLNTKRRTYECPKCGTGYKGLLERRW